ncbi:MAG: hypothetical protein HQK65_02055 [Desulfamplus sp.]|nr:hypothetical protein [Desulfamplus sp.]
MTKAPDDIIKAYEAIQRRWNYDHYTFHPAAWKEREKRIARRAFAIIRKRQHEKIANNCLSFLQKMEDPMTVFGLKDVLTQGKYAVLKNSHFSYQYIAHIFSRALVSKDLLWAELEGLNERKLEHIMRLVEIEDLELTKP